MMDNNNNNACNNVIIEIYYHGDLRMVPCSLHLNIEDQIRVYIDTGGQQGGRALCIRNSELR